MDIDWYNQYKEDLINLFEIFTNKFYMIEVNNILYNKFIRFIYMHSKPKYQLANEIEEEDVYDKYIDDILDCHIEMQSYHPNIYKYVKSSYELYKFLLNYTNIADILQEELTQEQIDEQDQYYDDLDLVA